MDRRQKLVAKLTQYAGQYGLKLIILHAPYILTADKTIQPMNIGSTIPSLAYASIDILQKLIPVCRMLERNEVRARIVAHIHHPSTLKPGDPNNRPSRPIEEIIEILNLVDPNGYILIENLVLTFPSTEEELKTLAEAGRRLTLDLAHLHLTYEADISNRRMVKICEELLPYIDHWHLCQILNGQDHYPITSGIDQYEIWYPDFAEILLESLKNGISAIVEVGWDYERKDPSAMINSWFNLKEILRGTPRVITETRAL
jgi:hypothetical protein